jgi:hypothetical protein
MIAQVSPSFNFLRFPQVSHPFHPLSQTLSMTPFPPARTPLGPWNRACQAWQGGSGTILLVVYSYESTGLRGKAYKQDVPGVHL